MRDGSLYSAEKILLTLQERGHVLKDSQGNTAPVMRLAELYDIIHEGILIDREQQDKRTMWMTPAHPGAERRGG